MRSMLIINNTIQSLYLKRLLKSQGIDVLREYRNCEASMSHIISLKPDFVIMDFGYKGGQKGIECVKEFQKVQNIPVIYITGESDPSLKQKAEETNCLAYLLKPVSSNEILNVLPALNK